MNKEYRIYHKQQPESDNEPVATWHDLELTLTVEAAKAMLWILAKNGNEVKLDEVKP